MAEIINQAKKTLCTAALIVLVCAAFPAQVAGQKLTVSWVFRTITANYESPNSEVWLRVIDRQGTRLLRCGQTEAGLPPKGVVDKATWSALLVWS
jgi:hypothetical protein